MGQSSLFGLLEDAGQPGPAASVCKPSTSPFEEWPEKERLAMEKEAIGFYVSGHPLHQYAKELQRYARPGGVGAARAPRRRGDGGGHRLAAP